MVTYFRVLTTDLRTLLIPKTASSDDSTTSLPNLKSSRKIQMTSKYKIQSSIDESVVNLAFLVTKTDAIAFLTSSAPFFSSSFSFLKKRKKNKLQRII
jgi:hypothetical protein